MPTHRVGVVSAGRPGWGECGPQACSGCLGETRVELEVRFSFVGIKNVIYKKHTISLHLYIQNMTTLSKEHTHMRPPLIHHLGVTNVESPGP